MSDLEPRLRASLRRHAQDAPPADPVVDRILAEAAAPGQVLRPRGGWRTWTMPLLAAAAVAAVVAGVTGVEHVDHRAAPPALSQVPRQPTPSVPAPTPTPSAPAPAPTTGATTAPVDPNGIGLGHFRAIDTTFVGKGLGWALGTADCLAGGGTGCAAMVRTTDGGRTWHSTRQPAGADVATSCSSASCIDGVRFATERIGYAYGPSALFMTTDGGTTWTREPGGAVALETLDGNVIRVSMPSGGDCGGPCSATVATAPIGTASWTRASVPGGARAVTARLVRSGSSAYLLLDATAGLAGGLHDMRLLASGDDGRHWTDRGDPCVDAGTPAAGLGVASIALAAAADGTVALLCDAGGANSGTAVIVHAPGPFAAFTATGAVPGLRDAGGELAVLDRRTLLVSTDAGLFRSADGGAHWQRQLPATSGTGAASQVGAEGAATARWLTDGGRTLWTTTDGGATWSRFAFS